MILANSCSQLPSFAPRVTQGPGKPQTLRALALLLLFVWQEHPRACSPRLESLPIQRMLVSVGCRCGGGGGSRGFAARGWVGRDPQGFWKQTVAWNPSLQGQYLPWESWMLPSLLPWSPFSRSSSRELLHMEKESHSRGKGNIPLSFPGCCLLESFPLPLPLEQMLWDGTSSCFTPGGVLTFAKAEGSSGREFLSQWVEDWRIGRC